MADSCESVCAAADSRAATKQAETDIARVATDSCSSAPMDSRASMETMLTPRERFLSRHLTKCEEDQGHKMRPRKTKG